MTSSRPTDGAGRDARPGPFALGRSAGAAGALSALAARAASATHAELVDRQRSSEELHDRVIQRLFATGLGLQVLADQHADAAAADQLRRHIADLDATIDEIRTQVFTGRRDGMAALSHQASEVGREAQLSAGVASVVS